MCNLRSTRFPLNQQPRIRNIQNPVPFVGALVFVLSFYWYGFPARYVLFANQDVTLFLTTSDYFHSFINHPGGLLEYTGSFLSQILRYRFPGAMLLGLMVCSAYYLAVALFRHTSDRTEAVVVGLLTAALVMAMHNYYPHRLHHSLGMILAILLANSAPSNLKGKRIYMLISVPVFYLVCGGFAWFYLVIWMIIGGFNNGRIIPETLLWGILYPALLLLISGRFLFLYPFKRLIFNPLPAGQAYGSVVWPVVFAVWMVLIPVLSRILNRVRWKGPQRHIVAPLIAVAVTILVLSFSYKRKNAAFFGIEEMAVREDWDELLRYVEKNPSTNLFGTFYTNLALCYQGRLCSDLLKYPQPFGRRGLCFEWDSKGEVLRRGSDFFWAIGHVNEAHHWAFESMVVDGITRRNLKRLIETELVTGNVELASKYIGLMNRTLFDRPLARYYAQFLENPGLIREDPVLGPRSLIRIREDFFADGIDLEKNLKSMVAGDVRTRPVFDYLMALYLLERRVDDVVALLPDYVRSIPVQLPVLLDETLLVYQITHREDSRTNLRVSQATARRFEDYAGILRQHRDQSVAAAKLYPGYGQTFWFYLNFKELIGY